MAATRVPPGRAGRLWLRHRLDVAERGAGLLERKLRIVREEHERLAERARVTELEWHEGVRKAETWLLRAEVIGGSSAVTRADVDAVVQITWATTMGVRHPDDGTCEVRLRPLLGNTALMQARDAYQAAALAGVRHAAAEAAVNCLAAEMESTKQRVRALNTRWIPRLRAELALVEFELEELERAEAVRRLRSSAR